ncbi:MAG: hypothetical protein EHM70_02190 [Chloroflexota bacterium]|nr:MAG: hypothetical protein EHM70_02190 [Chloroflexota bacterium]
MDPFDTYLEQQLKKLADRRNAPAARKYILIKAAAQLRVPARRQYIRVLIKLLFPSIETEYERSFQPDLHVWPLVYTFQTRIAFLGKLV